MLKISFDFNEDTKTVSNVKVETAGRSRILTTSAPSDNVSVGPDVEVLENKLQLSKSALFKLDAKADDRISVQYVSEGIGKSFPVIGKAERFTDRADGNRLTAKGTVSFRGEKRSTLAMFGLIFKLEDFKEGIFKLVPVSPDIDSQEESLSEEVTDIENLNNSEIEQEIEAIMSSEKDDDLPF